MRKNIAKTLILIIIFLILSILCKSNIEIKEKINYYIYENNLNFNKYRTFYNKYLKNKLSEKYLNNKAIEVFSEKIKYNSINKYNEGYELKVESNYPVPIIKDGIIVYIGEKEEYGPTIIVMTEDNENIWYGNITNSNYKVYDIVKKGELLGESKDEKIYLAFEKNGEYLSYENFLNY